MDVLFMICIDIMEEKRYHIKTGYSVEDVAGQNILIAPSFEDVDYSKMLVLSESAAFVVNLLIEHSLTFDEIITALNEEYEAEDNVVKAELTELLERFTQYNVLA